MSTMFGHPGIPVIGASGSVYGIMVYAACVNPRRILHMIFISIEIRYLVGFLVFIGLYYSFVGIVGAGAGPRSVADSAHLGGALWGFLAFKLTKRGVIASREWGPFAWWRQRRGEHSARSAHRRQETLDQILQKVHREGMGVLTPAERRFLERFSRKTRK